MSKPVKKFNQEEDTYLNTYLLSKEHPVFSMAVLVTLSAPLLFYTSLVFFGSGFFGFLAYIVATLATNFSFLYIVQAVEAWSDKLVKKILEKLIK